MNLLSLLGASNSWILGGLSRPI